MKLNIVFAIVFLALMPSLVKAQVPEGVVVLSPADTVNLENQDRRKRLERLSEQGLVVAPRFFEYTIPKKELKLKNLPVDIPVLRVVFDTRVFFDFNEDSVRSDSLPVVDVVANSLKKELPDVALVIAGHTDSVGNDEYNYQLGLRRARAVAELLAARGIRQVSIMYGSFGKKAPIETNDTEEGRAKNRRVEFLFAAHPNAVALWLSKQPSPSCSPGDQSCRIPLIKIKVPRQPLEIPSPNQPAPGEQAPKTVPLTETNIIIDLGEKRFEIPQPTK